MSFFVRVVPLLLLALLSVTIPLRAQTPSPPVKAARRRSSEARFPDASQSKKNQLRA